MLTPNQPIQWTRSGGLRPPARTADGRRQASQNSAAMLHPNQFKVNEAWLAFKVNELPIHTELEGDFNCVALMDAASCFILGSTFAPVGEAEPSKIAVRTLLKEAKAHKHRLPETLFIPIGQFNSILPAEAERRGIAVVRVPEEHLLVFIGEARASFKEHFGGGSLQ